MGKLRLVKMSSYMLLTLVLLLTSICSGQDCLKNGEDCYSKEEKCCGVCSWKAISSDGMFPQIRKICSPSTNTDHDQMCLKEGEECYTWHGDEEEHVECCEGTVCSGINGEFPNTCIAKGPIQSTPDPNANTNQMCLKEGEECYTWDGEEEEHECCEGTVCSGMNGEFANICIAKDPIQSL